MTDLAAVQALLNDAFQRVHELVGGVTDDLNEELSTFRPDADANSVGWLVWHLTRIQDDHLADAAGVDQVWPAWRDRFALPFDEFATRYLERLTLDELERVVDERWDPPVTVSVRLVSVISDCLQHLGQASYVRGLAERAAARG
jgi:hypothetical protein